MRLRRLRRSKIGIRCWQGIQDTQNIRGFVRWAVMVWMIAAPRMAVADPPITALRFAPDGRHLLVASQRGLQVCDPQTLQQQTTLLELLPPAVHSLQFSPAGDRLLVAGGIAGETGSVTLLSWPERSMLVARSVGEDVIYGCKWSADGKQFAVASLDGTAQIFDAQITVTGLGRSLQSLTGHSAGVIDLAWVAPGQIVTASRDTTLRLWDTRSGELQRTFNNHAGPLSGVTCRPASAATSSTLAVPLLASLSHDRTVRFWQPTIGRMVRFYRFQTARPLCAVWLPGGSRLAVGTTAGQIALIDPLSASVAETFDRIGRQDSAWITAVAVAPDGGILVAGDSAGNLFPFVLKSNKPSDAN